MRKRIGVFIAGLLIAGSAAAIVMQGETAAGVYGNVAITNDGLLRVDYSKPYVYRNVTTNGTVVVKSGAGVLRRIVFNTPGVLSQITIYDNTAASGQKIGTINSALGQVTLDYDLQYQNGLTLVMNGTTAADVTLVYF